MSSWKPLDKMTILSHYYPRIEGPEKVSGIARYTYDLQLPGMLYGGILTSNVAAGKIVKVDTTRAKQVPGVRVILTDIHPTGTIRFAGEEIAAVAATTPQALEEALRNISVEIEKNAFVVSTEDAMKPTAPRVFADRENVRKPRVREEGDVEDAFRKADVVVEAEFRTATQVHACLEVHGSVVHWEGDELIIYDSTQAVHGVRKDVASFLDISPRKVRTVCIHMGGGFGSKLRGGRYTAIAAKLAKAANAPVKLMLTRRQDFESVGNRPDSIQKIKIGATKDGRLIAMDAVSYGSGGISGGARVRLPHVYKIPNWRYVHHDVYTNAGPARPFRAPGSPQAAFSMDQLMDMVAEKLNMDPLELRLKNDPNPTRQKEWRLGAQKIGWQNRNRKPGSDAGPVKRGIGMAASVWMTGGRDTKAMLRIYPDGHVEVRCGTQDIGTGTRTYVASVTAEELGIPLKKVIPLIGDSDYPYSGASGGSTTAPSVAPAIKNTADKAREALTELISDKLGVDADEIQWKNNSIRVQNKTLSWEEACAFIEDEPIEVHGKWTEGLSSAGVAGVQFAQVAVDTETGHIQVERVVAVHDCGLILNRLTTESQINGGIIQGISYALLEERWMDPTTGTMVNANFQNYKIVGSRETPEIEVILYDEAERGVIGIGEPPTIPTAGAIANAVYNAIGVRLFTLPMTPDRVLEALSQQRS